MANAIPHDCTDIKTWTKQTIVLNGLNNEKIQIYNEQLLAAVAIMNGESVIISGEPSTGKSVLVQWLLKNKLPPNLKFNNVIFDWNPNNKNVDWIPNVQKQQKIILTNEFNVGVIAEMYEISQENCFVFTNRYNYNNDL